MVFYTTQDLIKHCQKNNFICNHCNSAHKTKETLQAHIEKDHKKPAPKPAVTSSPVGADAPEKEAEVPSADDMAKGAPTLSPAQRARQTFALFA